MKIVITGHKDSLNVGNMVMLLGLMNGVSRRLGEAEVMLLSDLPEEDRCRYGEIPSLTIVLRPWYRQQRASWLSMAIALFYLAYGLVHTGINRLTRGTIQLPLPKILRLFAEADLLVDISGDDLTSAYGVFSLLQVVYELLLARLFGLKTVLLAQAAGPFTGIPMRLAGWAVGHLVDLITFRDATSWALWQGMAARLPRRSQPVCRLTGDLVHLVPMPPSGVMADHGPIIVNLSTYIIRKGHGEKTFLDRDEGQKGAIGQWIQLLQRIHDHTNREILLLGHTFRHGTGDDRVFLRVLYHQLSRDFPVRFPDRMMTTGEIQRLVAQSSFVIGSRMHLALTALCCHVPFLALAYSHKYDQLKAKKRYPVCPVLAVERQGDESLPLALFERFRQLWDGRKPFKAAIRQHAEEAKKKSEENFDQLLYMIRDG